jgi:AraC-like DNA-binding protein
MISSFDVRACHFTDKDGIIINNHNSTPSELCFHIRFNPHVANRGCRNSNPSGLGYLLTLKENWKSRNSKDSNASLHENRLKEVFSLKSIEKTDDFMSTMVDVFESHFDSESLDADKIARLLHISRPQLYRKIAAISDMSVMELLRNFRLEKATQLMLRDPEKNIKKTAFLTGFK